MEKEKCRYCGEVVGGWPCRSTRDMEEREKSKECFAALMMLGGGEYSINKRKAIQLFEGCVNRASSAALT